LTESLLRLLQRVLIDEYAGLRRRLARRFGSAEFASEVLHDAWLHIDRIDDGVPGTAIHNPTAYLYRIALNIAADHKRGDQRRLQRSEVDLLCRQAEQELDPARIAEARSELRTLITLLDELPERRRGIFIAARLEELPYQAVAERFGVTVRIVEREVKAAFSHFSKVINQKQVPRRGPRPAKPS
jgi:RNA polymerase sigma-70 factor (ECF subfamily)